MGQLVEYAKQHTPNSLRVVARRAMLESHNAKMRLSVPVVARCGYENVYHCATRKTASQWITAMFSDPVVYRHSGLLPYVPRYYNWRHPQAIPPGRIALSLFVSYKRFATIPKPGRYRAFFVMRDPRDMVVSNYFSTRDSHAPMGDVLELRKVLQDKSTKDGLLYLIDHLARKKTFGALRSWAVAPDAEGIRLVRYEDLIGERQKEEMEQLMRHCGIAVPPAELETLLDRYSFSRMKGRTTAGPTAHYRKGKAGDWQNHFDDDIYEAFAKATGDLVELLGYPARGR